MLNLKSIILTVALLATSISLADTTRSGPLDAYQPTKVSEHTWVIHGPTETPTPQNQGFMNNPAFSITDNSVVVFDPGSSLQSGLGVLEKIRALTDKPITHVFITHVHGDHWLGNQAIAQAYPNARFFAHPKMIELAKESAADEWLAVMERLTDGATKGTVAVIPEEALTDGQEIQVDNLTIRTHLNEWAHSHTDAMFEIPQDKLLLAGDNATFHRIARMNDGSFRGNIQVMEEALNYDVSVVVPGHGPTGGKEILRYFRDYLSAIYKASEVAVEDDKSVADVKAELLPHMHEFEQWPGFEEEFGRHISLSILEVEDAGF